MRSVFFVLLLASSAYADEPSPDAWYPRLSIGAGIGWRVGDLALLHANGGSASLQAEVKVAPALFVGALYEYGSATGSDEEMRVPDADLTTHTAGLALRNVLMSFGEKPRGFGGDMFASVGLAREWIGWSDGDLARNVLMLGVGSTVIVPSERSHRQLRLNFRMLFARAPDPGKRPEGCDGPCDTATKTSPWDMSFVMEASCHFGR